MPAAPEIYFMTATELVRRVRSKQLSAMNRAHIADLAFARGGEIGPLHDLPVAHKDLAQKKGIRTTFGSPVFKDFIPEVVALVVERLKKAGAITVGKTNTPELGTGSQTYNEILGETLNPYEFLVSSVSRSGVTQRVSAAVSGVRWLQGR